MTTTTIPVYRSANTVRVYPVRDWGDVAIARHQARRLASQHGLAPRHAGEVAIVVSELASNIVKYGVRGDITVHFHPAPDEYDDDDGGFGGDGSSEMSFGLALELPDERSSAAITVVARDVGPPFHDLSCALLDGHDDRGPIDPAVLVQRGGLGTGLGAVVRLADRFEVHPAAGGAAGKEIIAGFKRRPATMPASRPA
jgi:serine/threonine-protein kinase RsbT